MKTFNTIKSACAKEENRNIIFDVGILEIKSVLKLSDKISRMEIIMMIFPLKTQSRNSETLLKSADETLSVEDLKDIPHFRTWIYSIC